jgi:NAD(P)-dependent dehydrogenase (short-subunit alcohol dehydrogenase family)
VVRRNVLRLHPAPTAPARDRTPFLPPGLVLLTDRPELAAALPLPSDATVLTTARHAPSRPGWTSMPSPGPEAISQWLAARRAPVRHVRLLSDLSVVDSEADRTALLALHDAAFLTVQANVRELSAAGSSVVALLLGGCTDRAPAAAAGVFTGLVKVIGLELAGSAVFAVCTTSTDPATGVRQATAEGRLRRTFPVVHHVGDTRLVPELGETPEPQGEPGLTTESVVVAVGGARGITAAVTKEIARRYRCRIHVLGSGRLTDEDAAVWAAAGGSRSAFLRGRLAEDRTVPVPELNREFDRLANAEAARETMAWLAEHCGAERVRYHRCDVTDADAVRAAVEEVLTRSGTVDLLVNGAGRNRSAPIADKRFAEFAAIRDVKVRGYWHLKQAFGDRQPLVWCNFGSLIGHFGQLGEADYASGNDFLASAASASAARGAREYTVHWTMWTGAGMAGRSGDLADSYFRRTSLYSSMSTAEGLHRFLDELRADEPEPVVLHVGDADERTFGGLYPGYLDGAEHRRGRYYLPGPVRSDGQSLTADVVFDLDVEGYLHDHLVRGVPTLPGAFVTELAAEAAAHLVPHGTVVSFVDCVFERFLHVHPEVSRVTKQVTARIAGETDGVTAVDVIISGDVRAPGGVLLVRDRTHFRARVLLAEKFPDPPRWRPWPDTAADTATTEPLAAADTTIALRGPFLALRDVHSSAGRARGTYRLEARDDHQLADAFEMPVFLIDCLARVGLVATPHGGPNEVRTPTGVARIERYTAGNDWDLTAAHGTLALYATRDSADPGGRIVALDADGQVLVAISGIESAVPRS